MALLSKNLIRYGLVLLGTAAAVGCSSEGDGGTDPGSITLTLSLPSASIQQGGSQAVTATLTRAGGFTGTVNLTVTGAPTGVTATVSNVVTTGAVTTATVTIAVGAATTPGVYPLVVHGTGSGVTEATANFSLTVTAAPAPAYTLTLSSPTLSIVQGGATPTVTVNLARTNFTGNVALSVENLPAGVTAAFNPVSPISGNSSVLTLTVSPTAAVGTTNLTVRGVATGLIDQTAPLALTITLAGSFTLAVTPAGGVTMVAGTSDASKTINITRTNYTPAITLTAESQGGGALPAGLTATFAPNPTATNASVLTLTATAAVVPNTYTLTIRGTGPAALRFPDDLVSVEATTTLAVTITAPAPSFALSLTQATLSIAQGASTPTTTVNIARTNFTGDVALSVLNLPTGVTASFAPANPQSGNSSVLTLTVAAGAPLGTFNTLSVQGVGTPGTVSTPLTLTITAGTPAGNFTLSTTPPTSVSVTQGTNANVTVNINRTGGNVSNIALTATGTLPTGMTLAFLPASTTTNSSVLTVTTTAATPVGAVPIVIRGNTTGLGEQTVNLTINVTAPSGSGNVTVSFATCPAEDKAVWLAFMDGTAGTWTAVTGVADVYNFNITQSKGSFAYVLLGTGTSTIIVQHMTQAELTAAIWNFCGTATPPPTRVANGTVSNIPANFLAQLSFARSGTIAIADGAFQITNAAEGTFDLIGYASGLPVGAGDRVFVKRGENPAPGGNFSVPVNFQDATLSAPSAAASATLTGLVGDETLVNHSMSFFTGGSACVPATLYGGGTTAAAFNLYGVPSSLYVGTDMHSIGIIANATTHSRFMTENFLSVPARAATPFLLPALHPTPVVTDLGGPYKRPNIAVTGVPAELNFSHSMTYQDQTVAGKSGFVSASQGWVGGSNLTLFLPNFAGVGVFNNAWAPANGDALNWTISSTGGTILTGTCAAGQRFVTSSRNGTL